jgi:ribosomal protein S13
MRLKRVGQLKEITKEQIAALEEEINKVDKYKNDLIAERRLLIKRLEEID